MKTTLISLTVSIFCLPLLPALEYWAPDPSFAGTDFHDYVSATEVATAADGHGGYFVWAHGFPLSGVGATATAPLVRFHEDTHELDSGFEADPRILRVHGVFKGPHGETYVGVELLPDPWETATFAGNHRLVRLFQNGQIDPLFASPLFAWAPRSIAFDSRGRIAVAVERVSRGNPHGLAGNSVHRILPDGRLDTGFSAEPLPVDTDTDSATLWAVAVDAEDRIFAGGLSALAAVVRYLPDGRLDASFVFDRGGELPGTSWTRALRMTPDGRLLAAGIFQDSSERMRPVLRMGMDGTLESGYDPVFIDHAGNPVAEAAGSASRSMDVRNGTIVLSGTAIRLMDAYGEPVAGVSGYSLTGHPLPDGATEWLSLTAFRATRLGNGSVLVSSVSALARGQGATFFAQVAPFVITETSEILPIEALAAVSRRSFPDIVRLAPDGRLVVGGGTSLGASFSRAGGQAAAGMAWFTADGIPDGTGGIADHRPTNIARTADGWLASVEGPGRTTDVYRFPDTGGDPVIVGESRWGVDRLFHGDGEGVYIPAQSESVGILLQSSASGDEVGVRWNLEVYAEGGFTSFPTTLPQVRLHRSAEDAFPDFGERIVNEVVGEFDDGGLLVLRSVAVESGFELIRLGPGGSPDDTFPPVFLAQSGPPEFVQPFDLRATIFDSASGDSGTVDVSHPGRSPVAEVVRAPGGGWIVAGSFSEIGGVVRDGLAKVLADGTIDPVFAAPRRVGSVLAGQRVDSVLVSDGGDRIWIAGAFTEFGGVRAPGILALDTEGRPLGSAAFAVRSTAGFAERALIARADENSLYLIGNVQGMGDAGAAGGISPGLVKLVRTTAPGEYWHPKLGEIHGYGSGGWFHVSGLGLLYPYGSGWHGHFADRGAGWVQVGEIYAPGVVVDAGLSLYHSAYGWFHLSAETGLHYRWAEEAWFAEW
ncbi:MAG: delta-60 repeat domain-containing protein [Opitutales bacterium]|nr:delta-60 repeat domain-containing protein [Opitutales bacterium]